MRYTAGTDELIEIIILYSKYIQKELPDEKKPVIMNIEHLKKTYEVTNLLINDLNIINLNLKRRINERLFNNSI